jgi:hypothetical protein
MTRQCWLPRVSQPSHDDVTAWLGGEMRVEAVVVVGVEERLGDWVTSRNTTVGCG